MHARPYLILIMSFVSLFGHAHTANENDGYYKVEHTWKCDGKQCSIALNVSTALYDYYREGREHLAYRYKFNGGEIPPNYYGFMLSDHDRPVIRALADEFRCYVATEKQRVQLALTFVQSLPYAYDSDTKGVDEYLRYPIETLVDGCGDCEDKVALLAALLYEMNIDFVLLVFPEHLALGVRCDGVETSRYLLFRDKKYYFLETTMEGWQIGQIPETYYDAELEVVPIDTTPNLLIRGVWFESQPSFAFEKAVCNLEFDLHNQGPGKVTELWAHVRLIMKGSPNRVLAEQRYSLNDLAEGEARTEKLSLKSHIKENSVLEVELISAEASAESYSLELNYSKTIRY